MRFWCRTGSNLGWIFFLLYTNNLHKLNINGEYFSLLKTPTRLFCLEETLGGGEIKASSSLAIVKEPNVYYYHSTLTEINITKLKRHNFKNVRRLCSFDSMERFDVWV